MYRRSQIRCFSCSLLGLLLLSDLSGLSAQTPSSPFTSTLSDFKAAGWTFSIGGSGLGGSNRDFEDVQLFVNPSTSQVDTVHSGTWTPEGQLMLAVGIGRVWISKRPLLADRVTLSIIGGKRSVIETFNGRIPSPPTFNQLQDTVLSGYATSFNVGVYSSFLRAFELSTDVFVEMGLGSTLRYDFIADFAPTNLHNIGDPTFPSAPIIKPYSASIEAIFGAGVIMWRGRFLRIQFAADLLQLVPLNNSSKISWIYGSYRPYRVLLNWDVHSSKPRESCAGPTHSEKAKELFGKEMRGWRKAKNNNGKRKN